MRHPIDTRQALQYEIESSWWAEFISAEWAQNLAGRYFAWKVRSKMGRVHAKARRMEEIYREHPELLKP